MRTRRALLGLAFLVIIGLLLGLTVAKFQRRFEDSVPVTMRVDRAGTQLNKDADVKLRGIVVGRVDEQRTENGRAVLTLALQPDDVDLIPANVRARILPKTLFGEKFVDLVVPPTGAVGRIAKGDVIGEDRSASALEVERVLADLFPLLRSLQPEKLSRALTGIADGLRGRGERLGANLEELDRLLAGIQPELPTIQADLSGFADLAESLDENAGELLAIARNVTVSAHTLNERDDVLLAFLRGTAGFVETTTAILDRDGDKLIRLADTSRPVLATVHAKRGSLPTTIRGLERLVADLNSALSPNPGRPEGALSIRLEPVPNRGAYTPADRPSYSAPTASIGPVGSPEEKAVIGAILGEVLDVLPEEVPDVAGLLYGPVLRGSEVALR